jgi:hypothetical protein
VSAKKAPMAHALARLRKVAPANDGIDQRMGARG